MASAQPYDAIVVGARCAGSSTAMLLARAGLRVLVIDRATFPSDTISGHMIKPAGAAYLKRWGLLDEVLASGCPPIRGRHVQFGEHVLDSRSPPPGSLPPLAPRRIVLDALLANAARDAGAEVREGTMLQELLWKRRRVSGARVRATDGRAREIHADLVIGADGRNSRVARLVGAGAYGGERTVSIAYYAYWSDFPTDTVEVYFQPRRMVGLFPTHHRQTLIFVQWPVAERAAFKSDIKGNYVATLRSAPLLADRLTCARQQTRILGMAELPNFFRQPFGRGWALVGDAGHHKDPLVARGISDAWRDSQLLADALIVGGSDDDRLRTELMHYQRTRDCASTDVARLNVQLARLDRPVEELALMWRDLAEAERIAERT